MNTDRSNVTEQREDFSRFVVHLTRDDRDDFPGGGEARDNFLSILDDKMVRAYRPHCLHHKKLKDLPDKVRDAFKVACFTAVPLSQLRFLTRSIEGRRIELAPYGFVFEKQFLIKQGAQPAIYINSYGGHAYLKESVDRVFARGAKGGFKGKIWRILPFVNAMHERYDFTWEREWRMLKRLRFELSDLVCAILPPEGEDDIRDRLADAGIAAISPEWTYERIVAELSRQQRMMRKALWTPERYRQLYKISKSLPKN